MERNIDIYASKLADEKLGKLGPGEGRRMVLSAEIVMSPLI